MNCVLIELSRHGKYRLVECRLCGNPIELPARLDLAKTYRACAHERPPLCQHLGECVGQTKLGCNRGSTPEHLCNVKARRNGKPIRCTPLAISADYRLIQACVLCDSYQP